MSYTLPEPDRIRLQHMLDAALEAQSFASGRTQADLEQNRMLSLSLAKCIEIIGEASSQITTETRAAYDEIPWRPIIAMRNRLIHGYFDIDTTRVWNTVINELPPLIQQLQTILREDKSELS